VCHPPSIDRVFAQFVVDAARNLDAVVTIAEDLPAGIDRVFPPAQLGHVPSAIMRCIPKKRAIWQQEFGVTQARVSCDEAIEKFVIAPPAPGTP
jgi:hypothetical protein